MEIYQSALIAGVAPEAFWKLSYAEIMECIEAYAAKMIRKQKVQAGLCYGLANLIGIAFNDPKKFPRTLQEAYPFVRTPARRGTWRESKEEFKAIAALHNRSMRR